MNESAIIRRCAAYTTARQCVIARGVSLVCVIAATVLVIPRATAAPMEMRQGARVALVASTADPPRSAQLAMDDLAGYLQRSLQAVVRRYPPETKLSTVEESAAVVIGSADDPGFADLVRQSGGSIDTGALGKEGARIRSAAVADKPVLFLVGSSWAGACHAVYSFLERELGIGFFIDGDRVPSWKIVDLADIDRQETPRVPIRSLFYHPTWMHPHANCCRLWSFEEWKQFLDWMRHRRLNVLPLFHDDGGYSWGDVIFDAFPQIPKNDKTLTYFITDPTWRTQLNRKIFAYARECGIHIAYNLFYTQVPQFVADYYPQLEVHPLRMRNVGIKFTQPECKELMRKYWRAILDTHGIDDSHIYIACSYHHELPLPEYLDSRNAPTKEMIDLIRELDPKARIYVESWCWNYLHEAKPPITRQQWLDKNALIEWRRFDAEIPRDIGVADWDRKQEPQRVPDPTFGGRPYIQLTHTTMETWWPPDTVRRHPRWVIDYFNDSIQHGAEGVMAFHIQANTNPLLADLIAEIGWRAPRVADYYRDYARRRFGSAVGDTMAASLSAFCDAVDMQPATLPKPVRGTLDDKSNFLTFPGVNRSAEELLYRTRTMSDKRPEWLKQQLEIMQPKAALAARAVMLARGAAPLLKDDPMYQEYLWQLDYVSARVTGIEGLYQSHLTAATDIEQSRRYFDQAVTSFESLKALFRGNARYKMSELRNVEPDVPFIQSYLDNWEFRGAQDDNAYQFHVVWERFPMFEEFLWSLRPPQLGPVKPSSLDTRAWFDVKK